MKRKNWRRWEFWGLLFTLAAGNLLHFVYDWSGRRPAAAVISAVNESTWEHMKLLAVPWLAWTAAELIALRGALPLAARAAGLLAGLSAIPVLYYTALGVWGHTAPLVNILIFQLAVLAGWWTARRTACRRGLDGALWQLAAAAALLGTAVIFVWWTFAPPELPLFADPLTGITGRGE